MIVADKKREQIIEGAIKRFSHFGINKTTMNDIAEDLAVSKPSLYYYFPDKKHLILGVIEKIFNEFFDAIQKKFNPDQSLETSLVSTIDVRNTFFQKYYMLKLAEGVPDLFSDEIIKIKLTALRDLEKDFFAKVFTHAKEKGEIQHEDMNYVAELYLESLMGLTTMCVMETGKDIFPDKKNTEQNDAEAKRPFDYFY